MVWANPKGLFRVIRFCASVLPPGSREVLGPGCGRSEGARPAPRPSAKKFPAAFTGPQLRLASVEEEGLLTGPLTCRPEEHLGPGHVGLHPPHSVPWMWTLPAPGGWVAGTRLEV